MISKELLSAILGLHCGIKSIKNSEVIYWFDCIGEIREHSINIYELAHKSKEWAVNLNPNKHALSSYPRWGDIRNYKKTNGSYYICQHLVNGAQFEAETEPEAIFKACQWILDKDSK